MLEINYLGRQNFKVWPNMGPWVRLKWASFLFPGEQPSAAAAGGGGVSRDPTGVFQKQSHGVSAAFWVEHLTLRRARGNVGLIFTGFGNYFREGQLKSPVLPWTLSWALKSVGTISWLHLRPYWQVKLWTKRRQVSYLIRLTRTVWTQKETYLKEYWIVSEQCPLWVVDASIQFERCQDKHCSSNGKDAGSWEPGNTKCCSWNGKVFCQSGAKE